MTALSTRILAFKLFLTPKTTSISIVFGLGFYLLAAILANIVNVSSILSAPYSFFIKVKLLGIVLFEGTFTSMGYVDILFLIAISVLFGLNVSLVMSKLAAIKKGGRMSVVFGTGFISIISAGCASCGLSAASLLGLGGAFAFLPFHGVEFYVLSLFILLASLYINLGAFAKACKLYA